MAEETKDEQVEVKESKKGMKSIIKWIILCTLLLILLAAGFGGWKYYEMHSADATQVKNESQATIGAIWPVGTMIVNLMDGSGERYLKTVIQVETSSEECMTELNLLKPKIVDNVLDLLSSKKYKEIVGYEGKQQLREEISMRINNYLSKGRITHVYFTEFVIQ
jgi:flagellar FliL protein